MRRHIIFLSLIAGLVIAFSLTGCQQCSEMIGNRTVENPEEESPDWVVQQMFIGAMNKDSDAGYAHVRPYLHSFLTDSVGGESSFRSMNFQAIRRKIHLFTIADDTKQTVHQSKPHFEVDYTQEVGSHLKVFIVNEKSDVPTPCTLQKDRKKGGNWRIKTCL